MNEHITLTEMEKQKEKQRKMREALEYYYFLLNRGD